MIVDAAGFGFVVGGSAIVVVVAAAVIVIVVAVAVVEGASGFEIAFWIYNQVMARSSSPFV